MLIAYSLASESSSRLNELQGSIEARRKTLAYIRSGVSWEERDGA